MIWLPSCVIIETRNVNFVRLCASSTVVSFFANISVKDYVHV